MVSSTNETRLPPNGRKICIVMISLLVGRRCSHGRRTTSFSCIHYRFFSYDSFLLSNTFKQVGAFRWFSFILSSCFLPRLFCLKHQAYACPFFILPLIIYSQFYWQKCFSFPTYLFRFICSMHTWFNQLNLLGFSYKVSHQNRGYLGGVFIGVFVQVS